MEGTEVRQDIILPRPILEKEPEPAQKESLPEPFRHFAVREAFERIHVTIVDQELDIKTVNRHLTEALNFLFEQFGNPVYARENIELIIGLNQPVHAIMSLSVDNTRSIRLDRFNVTTAEGRQFLVHELFHAFYQSNIWLRKGSETDIESWPTYAQYRYFYRSLEGGNPAIAQKLKRDFPNAEAIAQKAAARKQPLATLNVSDRQNAYIGGALPLFSLPDYDVYKKYRYKIMIRPTGPAALESTQAAKQTAEPKQTSKETRAPKTSAVSRSISGAPPEHRSHQQKNDSPR